ncbi:MAG: hypothetical protein LBR41_02630 [Rickettsiales bacterium]|jgi:type IV secretory pathway component VirB8|nr:hypothetical protein [Rickettsiales bacterium]
MSQVQPSVLVSRVITFVFAAAFVAAIVMILALSNMWPLERTQVFFLTQSPAANTTIKITPFEPSDNNALIYKENFVREYIKMRNEIVPNSGIMQSRWRPDEGGVVYAWSAADVFVAFFGTHQVFEQTSGGPGRATRCTVEFTRGVTPHVGDQYTATFRHICDNNAGQQSAKDYTIIVTLAQDSDIPFVERLDNPMGIRVTGYSVQNGARDPLDFI